MVKKTEEKEAKVEKETVVELEEKSVINKTGNVKFTEA